MKRSILLFFGLLVCVVTIGFADSDPGWPREVKKEGATLVYYQPQIDAWKNYRDLGARLAFSLTSKAGGQPALGVASFSARTMVDHDAGTVVIKDIEMTDVRFPSLDAASATETEKLLRKMLSFKAMTISLDRLTASVERSEENIKPVDVKLDAPQIFVSQTPAILLSLDGDPAMAPIEGTQLQFVINTGWDVFFDKAKSRYFLLNNNIWLTSDSLGGTWTGAGNLPADMSKLPANQNWDDVKKNVPPRSTPTSVPKVFFTSAPAELILFKGKPVYSSVTGTNLVYASNTDSDVFVQSDEQQYYFLTSGRWFRTKSLDGPWTYAGGDLPKDFYKIPATSPKADVLSSIPGTQQAKDAVLLAEIPNTVVVTRAEAEAAVKISYDGEPQFKPIEGTKLSYASNTQDKIIKTGDLYYLCFQGVWFMSTSPNGPWKTADSVPTEIYTIPPSSPVYNVTYVTVSNPTTTTVECSHTAGYVGMFVVGAAVGAAIVYGTGYYYHPYIYYPPHYGYPIYRPYPYTYGVHAVYNPYSGGYKVGHYAYGPYAAAGGSAWYNPSTGRYGRAATVQTPYGGRSAAGGYNPWTGNYAATRQGSSPYAQWGSSAVKRGDDYARAQHVTTNQGTVARVQGSNGNNVYAGHDGNVYKRDSSGSWNELSKNGWNSVDTSKAKEKYSGLNREASSRQLGTQRTQQRAQPTGGGARRRPR